MLALVPPFPQIEGVSFLPDHANPLLWYYLPITPHLATVVDSQTGAVVPQLSLIKVRGAEKNAGFVTFDVVCDLDPARLDDLALELKRVMKLTDKPILSPVPLTDGTVKMMLFELESPGSPGTPGAPPKASSDGAAQPSGVRFATKITHDAHPELYGQNRAAFSVELSQEGVTVLEQALAGLLTPIGIVYSLAFLALRPAYEVKVDVDWERVQDHLDKTFGISAIFTSVEISDVVDKLIENRSIKVSTDTFVPEDSGDGVLARRDQAVAEVKEMITNAFFEPSLNPVKKQEDAWDKIEHLAETASALAATGGWAGIGSFTYRNVHYTRVDAKSLNVAMTERTTVTRRIYPQAHLSGLLEVLRQPGIDLDRFVTAVDLDDPWFSRRAVRVIARTDFTSDQIASIAVTLAYAGKPPQTVVLDAANTSESVEWSSSIVDGVLDTAVTATYTVHFAGVDGTERPRSLTSAPITVDSGVLEVFPRDVYSVVAIPVRAQGVPFDRYPLVEVAISHHDPDHGVMINDVVRLDAKTQESEYQLFTMAASPTWSYEITYRGTTNKDVVEPWRDGGVDVVVRDPFPASRRRTLEIAPALDWNVFSRAFVDVSYSDPANDVYDEASFTFDQSHEDPQRFGVDLADATKRRVSYSISLLTSDGRVVTVPASQTLERRIIVRPGMNGHRIVAVRPEQIDFAARGVRSVDVDLRYVDDANGVSFLSSTSFDDRGDVANFEFDLVDPTKTAIEYRLSTSFTNGMSVPGDWATAPNPDELVVPVGRAS